MEVEDGAQAFDDAQHALVDLLNLDDVHMPPIPVPIRCIPPIHQPWRTLCVDRPPPPPCQGSGATEQGLGWACCGDRPEGLVNHHRGQDNKQEFSEKNLEYVSQSVNSQRSSDFKKQEGVREAMAKVVPRVAPTIKVPGSGSSASFTNNTLLTNNAPVKPDGGDLVVDLTVDDGREPNTAQPTGPSGPSVEQQRIDAFAKIMPTYRREAKRPRPDDDDRDDVVDADVVVDLTI